MKTVASLAVSVLGLLTGSVAHAEGTHGEVSALVGYGTSAFQSGSTNNFGFGVGLRTGVTIGKLWLGVTASYQFGNPEGILDIDTSGNEVDGQYALSTFSGGGEIGLSLRVAESSTGALVIRPFAYAGTNVYVPSPLNTYSSETGPQSPIVRFVVAPSLHLDYELARSGIFFGTDLRVNLLVPGTAPRVKADGTSFPVTMWYSTENFTAELSVFAVIGKRF